MDNVLVSISALCEDEAGEIVHPVAPEWHEVSFDTVLQMIDHMASMHPDAHMSIVTVTDERVAIIYTHNLSHMLGMGLNLGRDCQWLYMVQRAVGSDGVIERLADLMLSPGYCYLVSETATRQ